MAIHQINIVVARVLSIMQTNSKLTFEVKYLLIVLKILFICIKCGLFWFEFMSRGQAVPHYSSSVMSGVYSSYSSLGNSVKQIWSSG